jgi:hypothetical protein
MQAPANFERIVNGKRYSVATATLLADNTFWDGHNHERQGRNTFLYRTPNGAYFTVNLTMWQGEADTLNPISESEAIELYETGLSEHHVSYELAFPTVNVEDA